MLIAGGAKYTSPRIACIDGKRFLAWPTWDRLIQKTRELLREFILKRCNPVTAEAPELVAAAALASLAMPQ
jgi:hypothetical protein